MARRRRSYRRSYAPRRSYSAPRRRRSYRSGGGGRGQALRIVLQQPGGMGMGAQRPPFGTFQPTAMFNPFMMPYYGQGAPMPAQGGPGIPGARMVINPMGVPGDIPEDGPATPAPPTRGTK